MRLTVLNIGQNYRITGGSDSYFMSLERLLTEHGHTVIPFAAKHPNNVRTEWEDYFPVAADFDRPGILDVLRFVYSQPAREAISRLLHDVRVDIAHLHIYYGKLTASILKPLYEARVPIVQTLHEFKVVCPTYALLCNGRPCDRCRNAHFWHALANRCNRQSVVRSFLSALEAFVSHRLGTIERVNHFIAVSDFVRQKVIDMGVPAGKISTVYNFLDASDFTPARKPGRHFLYAGRIEREKGVFTLVKAAQEIPEVPLIIAGTGSCADELKAYVDSHGLSHIKMVGFVEGARLQELFKNALCTVVPSECMETFGLTSLESFAHGRPVVATRTGGIPEVVTHGENGFLCPPGDAAALRTHLMWMATHRQKATSMGFAGRRKLDSSFHPERHYARIYAIYRKALEQKKTLVA